MAMDQKARSAKSAAKRKELGEEELRHREADARRSHGLD